MNDDLKTKGATPVDDARLPQLFKILLAAAANETRLLENLEAAYLAGDPTETLAAAVTLLEHRATAKLVGKYGPDFS